MECFYPVGKNIESLSFQMDGVCLGFFPCSVPVCFSVDGLKCISVIMMLMTFSDEIDFFARMRVSK